MCQKKDWFKLLLFFKGRCPRDVNLARIVPRDPPATPPSPSESPSPDDSRITICAPHGNDNIPRRSPASFTLLELPSERLPLLA